MTILRGNVISSIFKEDLIQCYGFMAASKNSRRSGAPPLTHVLFDGRRNRSSLGFGSVVFHVLGPDGDQKLPGDEGFTTEFRTLSPRVSRPEPGSTQAPLLGCHPDQSCGMSQCELWAGHGTVENVHAHRWLSG